MLSCALKGDFTHEHRFVLTDQNGEAFIREQLILRSASAGRISERLQFDLIFFN